MSFEETQKILAPIIKKPQLTIQLLSRPPFKFIVDIVSNVVKSTGYLGEEFSLEVIQNAGNDKNSKTLFLEKLIEVLDDGTLNNVKSSKILSGKDAEETNKLLQKLGANARSFTSKTSSTDSKKPKKTKNDGLINKKTEQLVTRDSDGDAEKLKKSKKSDKTKKTNDRHKTSGKKKKEKKEKTKIGVKTTEKIEPTEEIDDSKKTQEKLRVMKRADSMIAINGDPPYAVNNDVDPLDEGYDEIEELEHNVLDPSDQSTQSVLFGPVPSSVRTNDSVINESPRLIPQEIKAPLLRPTTGAAGGRPMTSMGRPGTASSRPAPPKIKKKQIATVDSIPQIVVELKSEIISELDEKTDSEKNSNFVMEQEEELDERIRVQETVDQADQGTLVQKIMEKKAEIEDGQIAEDADLQETDSAINIEKEKMRILQDKLQSLTKSAYPLTRLFDFANDDIESMVKELERWRSEHRRKEQEHQNKKAGGFGDSSRLYNIIANLEKEINDMKEELSKVRGRVLNNDRKIQLFVANI